MSTQVQGALIIAAAVLIAGFGAAYMLSPERDVERCVRIVEDPGTARQLFTDHRERKVLGGIEVVADVYAVCFAYIHIPQDYGQRGVVLGDDRLLEMGDRLRNELRAR